MDYVCVKLMNEGVVCYKSAPATLLSSSTAKLLIHPTYDPDDEEWEVKPGSTVQVAKSMLSGGEFWVAVDLIEGVRSSFLE